MHEFPHIGIPPALHDAQNRLPRHLRIPSPPARAPLRRALPPQIRLHQTGTHGENLDPLLPQHLGILQREHVQRRLAHTVRADIDPVLAAPRVRRERQGAQPAADVEQVRTGGFAQEGRKGVGDEGGADDVGVEGVPELFPERRGLGVYAGVVHEDVEAAVFARHARGGGGDGGLVRDVELDAGDLALDAGGGADGGAGRVAFGERAAGHEDVVFGGGGGYDFGCGVADAGVGAWEVAG